MRSTLLTALIPGAAIATALAAPCLLTAGQPLHEAVVPRLLGVLVAFVPYLWLVANRRRLAGRVGVVLIAAVAARVALLPVAPTFSDDVYRYAWDARVMRAGFGPYDHAPSAQAVAHLRDELIWPNINHPDLRTIYPPVTQAMFWLFSWLGPGILPMKLLAVGFDLATALLLAWMLNRRGRDPADVALYALNPLVIAETAMSGHMDPLAWFFLLGALALVQGRSAAARIACGAALALSVGAKLLAAAILPFVVRRRPILALSFSVTLVLSVAPFAMRAGPAMFESLDTYGRTWRGNAGAYALIETAILESGAVQAPKLWQREQQARKAARVVVVVLFASVLAWLWLRRAGPEAAAFAAVAAFVVLSPTVQPWYVAWLAPFFVFGVGRAWVLLTCLSPLTYLALPAWLDPAVGQWVDSPWIAAAVWGPFATLLAWDFLHRRPAAAA